MIELLDELTEIPFDIFWEKYQEKKPGTYNEFKAKAIWFSMHENNRIMAFSAISWNHPALDLFLEPYELLEYFELGF
jgi:hypothetical protein